MQKLKCGDARGCPTGEAPLIFCDQVHVLSPNLSVLIIWSWFVSFYLFCVFLVGGVLKLCVWIVRIGHA